MIAAVVFDLDGVIIDTERLWDIARRDVAAARGGTWTPEATVAMQGMSSPEWSRYMRDAVGVQLPAEAINRIVVDRLLQHYRERLPLLPGAVGAVRRLAARWPLALASSSNREIIDEVLVLAGVDRLFAVTVSSEEVARGKPAPDVYLEAARRLGVSAGSCAAVEDSTNGIHAAWAAGMKVIAVPNRDFPPDRDALDSAAVVISSLDELTSGVVGGDADGHD